MLQVTQLSRSHNRSDFDCGKPALNAFLKATARQHGDKGVSRTIVLTDSDAPEKILGFFTLTVCEVQPEGIPAVYSVRYPSHKLPALRLARLAVDKRRQKEGFGGILLAEAIHRAVLISDMAGIIGLFVEAKDSEAVRFYEHFGFIALPSQSQTLFLPIETLRGAVQR